MAESLAVRWRPRRFADVAGQGHISAVLRAAAARPVPPQQILLAGPSGLGKTTTARIFAAALLCPNRMADGDACGLCPSCMEITGPAGGHPDVIELDAASNGGKDEIRDLAARAVLAPLRGRFKVYIIDEAHGLTSQGGQAFLRLLEEPPGHCLFVLATTDPGKLPTALRGRCVHLEVLAPARAELVANLARIAAGEDWDLSEDVIDAVLAASDPALGVRGTVMTLDKLSPLLDAGRQITPDDLAILLGVSDRVTLREVTDAIVAGERAKAVRAAAEIAAAPAGTHLRAQLTAWAQERLTAAGPDEFEMALYRFATLVEAPTYPGALLVAVARAADARMGTDVQAVRALVSGALEHITGPARPEATSPPHPAPHPPAPTPAHAAPAPAAPTPPPARTAPPAPAPVAATAPAAPVASGEARPPVADPAAPEGIPTSHPAVLALLNAVAKVHGPSAFLLRQCTFTMVGTTLLVTIPPAQQVKARTYGLGDVLAGTGLPVRLA